MILGHLWEEWVAIVDIRAFLGRVGGYCCFYISDDTQTVLVLNWGERGGGGFSPIKSYFTILTLSLGHIKCILGLTIKLVIQGNGVSILVIDTYCNGFYIWI